MVIIQLRLEEPPPFQGVPRNPRLKIQATWSLVISTYIQNLKCTQAL